jgi:hypothetical protein
MSSLPDPDPIEPTPDEVQAETFSAGERIGVTFASGMHESDLLSFLERARGLAGEVC